MGAAGVEPLMPVWGRWLIVVVEPGWAGGGAFGVWGVGIGVGSLSREGGG